MVRLTTLTGMEQAMLALYGCAASIVRLSLCLPGVPVVFTLPCAVISVPALAAAFWLASRYRARLQGRVGPGRVRRADERRRAHRGLLHGMVVTRRIAPLGRAGTLTLILPLTIWASGAPLATAITGVAAYRILRFLLPLPFALVSLPVLREATRQATITGQAGPGTATETPCRGP